MPIRTTRLAAAGLIVSLWAPRLMAQTDYRHLDAGRPVRVSDAYPVERYAFEISFPWSVSREGGNTGHELAPHLEFGAARNLMVGVETDIRFAGGPGRELRLHRLETSLLWNLRRETPSLPASWPRTPPVVRSGRSGGRASRSTGPCSGAARCSPSSC